MWELAHHLLLGVAIAALSAAGVRVASVTVPSGPERALAAVTFGFAAAVLWALGLGLLALGSSPAALTAGAVATWALARLVLPAPPLTVVRELDQWWRNRHLGTQVAAGGLIALLLLEVAWLSRYPYPRGDSITYHLTEVVTWIQNGQPGSRNQILPLIPVENYPITHEVGLTWLMSIARGFSVVAPYQLAFLILLSVAIAVGLRHLGVPAGFRILAVAAGLTIPAVVDQLNGPVTDMPALAWAAVTGALCAAAPRRPALLAPAVVAAGLAIGTKTTVAAPVGIALLASILVTRRLGRSPPRSAMALAVATALCVGGIWYLRNALAHGSPLWPLVSVPWGTEQPALLSRYDARFIEFPARTMSEHGHEYLRTIAGGCLLLAGGLLAPLLARRRAVAYASMVAGALTLAWMSAPYTGDILGGSTARYLLSAPLVGLTALALAAASRPGLGWFAAASLMLGALVWNLTIVFRYLVEFVPPNTKVVLALTIGVAASLGASRIALARLPSWTPAVLIVIGTCALAPAAGGYIARHAEVGYFDSQLIRYLSAQPAFANGNRPVAQTPWVHALLVGDRLDHRIRLVTAAEGCPRVRAHLRDGWLVVNPIEYEDYERIARAVRRCLQGYATPTIVAHGFLVYAPRG
jgi:hypothetical protein